MENQLYFAFFSTVMSCLKAFSYEQEDECPLLFLGRMAFLTNAWLPFDQSVFNNTKCLGHLLINGGGPSSKYCLIRLLDKGFARIMMVSKQI